LQGNYGKAIESFKQAKELAPPPPEVRRYLGNAYSAAKRYPEAVKEFQELVDKEPDWEPARPALAKALRAEGRIAEADQILLGPVPEKWDAAPQLRELGSGLRGQIGEAPKYGGWGDTQFIRGKLATIQPKSLKTKGSGSGDIPKIRRDKPIDSFGTPSPSTAC
jgi:tetratricopeptide (TPR) repeat protein